VPGLFEERAGLADGVADRGPADLEKVGEYVHRAQSALVEDGQKDAFAVADLMGHAGGRHAGVAGSPMGRVYRETTPGMLARVTAVLDDRIGRAEQIAASLQREAGPGEPAA